MNNRPSQPVFPRVSGDNLNRRRYALPGDFEGELNLLFIAFQQWHQMEVNSWVPYARQMAARFPDTRYYELPTIRRMNPLFQSFIDSGMRAGIPDNNTRAATITLYIDKEPFCRALGIRDESHIFVALVDRAGSVRWQTYGPYDPARGRELDALLSQLLEA